MICTIRVAVEVVEGGHYFGTILNIELAGFADG